MSPRRVVLLVLALGGCMSSPSPLDDRGELVQDIAAPPPEHLPRDPPVAPDDPWRVEVHVMDDRGRPVPDARVWLEGVDLRQPLDNLDAYLAVKLDSLQLTDPSGTVAYRIEDAVVAISASKSGFLPNRTAAQTIADDRTITLVLAPADVAVIAHRGASYYAPENTFHAMRKAAHLGARFVELDVRLTRDGHPVIFHDPDVARTTDGRGRVDDLRLSDLRSLDAGAWLDDSFEGTQVPRLDEALRLARELGLHVILDLKATAERAAQTREVVAVQVHELGMRDQVTLAAFRKASVSFCVDVGLRCGYISNGTKDGPTSLAIARDLGAHVLLMNQTAVGPGLAADARAAGLELVAWTANTRPEVQRLHALGVDGVLTDRPSSVIRWWTGA